MTNDPRVSRLRDAGEDIRHARVAPDTPQAQSPSYRLAYADLDFLTSDAMRGVRLQLEMSKVEQELAAREIVSTVVIFGSARIRPREEEAPSRPAEKGDPRPSASGALTDYYSLARDFARAVTRRSQEMGGRELVVVTGGGPGIMEAGNRGAADAGGQSVGFNIVLPHEQGPNVYVTPELCFNFHYFAIRKMHFLMRARALAIFPGGFGTLDEMFEAITLIQTGRMKPVPILLFGRSFWDGLINWQALIDAGTIARDDLRLVTFVDGVEDAMAVIDRHLAEG